MFNVRQIIRNNDATFYDFNTRKRRSQTPRYVVVCLASLVAAVVCPKVSDNLLAGVLAVQSILLGFTVNVMFFLLGNREKETPEVPGFLRGLSPVEAYVHWLETSKVPIVASAIVRGGAMFVFYAISIEVVFSIARVIGRTSFYFERKMGEVRRPDDQGDA